jgi:hypothetical protein
MGWDLASTVLLTVGKLQREENERKSQDEVFSFALRQEVIPEIASSSQRTKS